MGFVESLPIHSGENPVDIYSYVLTKFLDIDASLWKLAWIFHVKAN